MALVCNPLVPGLCLIYAPPLVHHCPLHRLQLIPSSPIVVHLTPIALGLCLLTSCAFSCCLFTLIRLHMPLVYPFALVCTCCCHSCHMYCCTCACPRTGPWFVCARPAHIFSVCSSLPIKAKLEFFKRNLYLPLHLTQDTYKQMNT